MYARGSQQIKKLSISYRDKVQKALWIEIALTSVKTRRKRVSMDSLAVERYREAVEIAQKQFFKEEKDTDMNAIKHVA